MKGENKHTQNTRQKEARRIVKFYLDPKRQKTVNKSRLEQIFEENYKYCTPAVQKKINTCLKEFIYKNA